MRLTIETLPPRKPVGRPLQVFIAEPESVEPTTPVLLYLHGKGEASPHLYALPMVLFFQSPPLQAFLGNLRNVIVVAPQAPADPHLPTEAEWTWQDHVAIIGEFLSVRFKGRRLVAAGFSRGGRGVLQFQRRWPGRLSAWASIDPQRPDDPFEEEAILESLTPAAPGWLRYGNGIPANMPFSQHLAERADVVQAAYQDLGHVELAIAAFKGDRLGGSANMYRSLGLTFRPA